jgi:outer membrane translocation and assembly module TamA
MGIGYGTEDGPRGSFEWRHRNFAGGARTLGVDARYSLRLRGLGLDFVQPHLGGTAIAASLESGAFWESEPIYTARRVGGRAGLTWRTQNVRGLDRPAVDRLARVTYTNESLRYTIAPDALDDFSNVAELIALGIDPASGSGSGRLGSLGLDLAQTVVDHSIDPRRGYSVSVHLEHAASWLGGTFNFQEVLVDSRAYVPLGASLVWASRLRTGGLISPTDDEVPFSARYFLGGSTSLRGWGRYEVSPLSADGVPIGGRSLLEMSTELRVPIGGPWAAVVFVDAGNVWDVPSAIRLDDLRVAVGPGIRWMTAFGAVRGDVGVQLNPIPGLLVDGEPQARRWRIHVSFGHAF